MPDPMLNEVIRSKLRQLKVQPNPNAPPVLQAVLEALERQEHNLRDYEVEAFELLLSEILPARQNPSERYKRKVESLLLDDEEGEPLLTAREVQDMSPKKALRLIVDHVASRFTELTDSYPPQNPHRTYYSLG